MLIQFFDQDPANSDLVDKVHVEFGSIRVRSMLMALPFALSSMLDNLPRMPESENSDFEAAETFRVALNGAITTAALLMELLDLQRSHKTISGMDWTIMRPYYSEACRALGRLEERKRARIAITHRDLGEHFGSRTGFQEFSHAMYASDFAKWMHERDGGLQSVKRRSRTGATCNKCGGEKGVHAIGESCNTNCGGTVVAC